MFLTGSVHAPMPSQPAARSRAFSFKSAPLPRPKFKLCEARLVKIILECRGHTEGKNRCIHRDGGATTAINDPLKAPRCVA